MLSSKPVGEISLERYEEHGRLDSERFPEVVTNDSNLSVKVNIQECLIYTFCHIHLKSNVCICSPERHGSCLLHIQILWAHRQCRQGFVGKY